jgi:hypothetical protein
VLLIWVHRRGEHDAVPNRAGTIYMHTVWCAVGKNMMLLQSIQPVRICSSDFDTICAKSLQAPHHGEINSGKKLDTKKLEPPDTYGQTAIGLISRGTWIVVSWIISDERIVPLHRWQLPEAARLVCKSNAGIGWMSISDERRRNLKWLVACLFPCTAAIAATTSYFYTSQFTAA